MIPISIPICILKDVGKLSVNIGKLTIGSIETYLSDVLGVRECVVYLPYEEPSLIQTPLSTHTTGLAHTTGFGLNPCSRLMLPIPPEDIFLIKYHGDAYVCYKTSPLYFRAVLSIRNSKRHHLIVLLSKTRMPESSSVSVFVS